MKKQSQFYGHLNQSMVAPKVQMSRSAYSDGGVLGDDGDSNAAEF